MLIPIGQREGADGTIYNEVLFGKYEVIRLLGKGSSSTVYLTRHLKLKDYRAIKCISKNQQPTQFQAEAKLLKNLNHPGIPIIYDMEEDQDNVYIIEEFIQGESLQTVMSESNFFSRTKVIEIAIQISEILEYLHGQTPCGVVYQDLKPEHIYLCGGQVRLIDFGIASYLTEVGSRKGFGTPGFAPPEKYQGVEDGIRADVYGLGAVVFYMLTNKVYESKRDGLQWWKLHSCSRNLRIFLQRTLEEDPQKRFRSIKEAKICLIQERDRINQNYLGKNGRKHLEGNYMFVSSKPGCGGTHIAISLTCYLNHRGRKAIYVDVEGSDWQREFLRYEKGAQDSEEGCCYRDFRGRIQVQGPGETETRIQEPGEIQVRDYGQNLEQMLEEQTYEECLVILLGSQKWDVPRALEIYQRTQSYPNVVYVAGYGSREMAKFYAGLFQREVYCFPLDQNLWQETREKRDFFKNLETGRRGDERNQIRI